MDRMFNEKHKHARILIVDDEDANIQLLRRILEPSGYCDMRSTTSPAEVPEILRSFRPDLVMLDLLMPDFDGHEVLQMIRRSTPPDVWLPVLVLTSDHSKEARRRSLSGGAHDFLIKPLSPSEVRLRVRNLLDTHFLQEALRDQNDELERRVRDRTGALEEARLQTLHRLARAAEYRDDATGQHTRRVGLSAALIAGALGLSEAETSSIRLAAPLHDLGKIGIPDSILLSTARLTAREFEVMKRHCVIGADLLASPDVALLAIAAEIALSHHECWDGSGYPCGLSAEAIPLTGRIVAIADTYDALTHTRPYKRAWSHKEALTEIRAQAGRQFDPAVVAAFETTFQVVGAAT